MARQSWHTSLPHMRLQRELERQAKAGKLGREITVGVGGGGIAWERVFRAWSREQINLLSIRAAKMRCILNKSSACTSAVTWTFAFSLRMLT